MHDFRTATSCELLEHEPSVIAAGRGRRLSAQHRDARDTVAAAPAWRALELGTITGYSALAIAAALPVDGRLTCRDVRDERTRVARRCWREAGVADSAQTDVDSTALRALNLRARDDSRPTSCLVSTADGVLLARKH